MTTLANIGMVEGKGIIGRGSFGMLFGMLGTVSIVATSAVSMEVLVARIVTSESDLLRLKAGDGEM